MQYFVKRHFISHKFKSSMYLRKVWVCDKIIKTNKLKLKVFYTCINKSDIKQIFLSKEKLFIYTLTQSCKSIFQNDVLASKAKSDLSTFKTLHTTAHLPETVQYVDNTMSTTLKF